MRIHELRLQNYRRFRAARIEFPDGLIGIVGRNGAGKSSLLESILWCLFGHDVLRTSKDLLKHQAAAPGEDVEAALAFELDGRAYEVVRRLKGRSQQPEAAVTSAGQALVAAGPNSWDQANRLLERLLGFDRTAFESTVIAKQGELAALSDLRPANRKKLLLGMLGVERIEDAIVACRMQGRLLEARVAEGRRNVEAIPRLEAERETAARELAHAESAFTRLTAEADALTTQHAEARRKGDELLALRLRDQELRLRLQSLQTRLENTWQHRTRLSAERQILADRQGVADRFRRELQALDGLDADQADLAARLRSAERRDGIVRHLDAARRRMDELAPAAAPLSLNGDAPEHLRTALGGLQRSMDEAVEAARRLHGEARVAQAELERIPSVDSHASPHDPCPVCRRPLGDSLDHMRQEAAKARREWDRRHAQARDEAGQAEQRRQEAQQQLLQLQARLRESELLVERSTAGRREWERAAADAARLEAEAAAVPDDRPRPEEQPEIDRRLRERQELGIQLARAEEATARLPRIAEEDRILRAQESEVQSAREAATRELQQTNYAPGTWEQANGDAERLARRLESLQRELVQLRERSEWRRRDVARIDEQLGGLRQRRDEVTALAGDLAVLDALAGPRGDVGLLCEFKTHMIGRIRPTMARATSDLLRLMTRGRYTELVLDDEYGGHLYDGATAHPLTRFSGGEVDVANLALRLAVSELVANARGRSRLQFVALDEVFGSQDEERRHSVLDALHSLSPVFRQILVVTHLEDVRERLEHVLRVEDGGDGTSRIVPSWQDKS